MNEEIIIESKRSKAAASIAIIGGCLILLAILLRAILPHRVLWWGVEYKIPLFGSLIAWPIDLIEGSFYTLSDGLPGALFYIGIILLLVGIVFIIAVRKVALTVTDKRVFGSASWGKLVELPIDMISAVATSAIGGIAVSTSSGVIKFKGIKNNIEIHAAISKLLLKRQEKSTETHDNNTISTSNSDEILKLHSLLEKGIITKEEFENKKKQLLDL